MLINYNGVPCLKADTLLLENIYVF